MRYIYDLYICNFGNLCAFKLYSDGRLLEQGDLVQLRISEERCKIYTYETIVFLFIEQLMQNIEKRYLSHLPEEIRKNCKVKIHTMIDEPFFFRYLRESSNPSCAFLKQYVAKKTLMLVSGFGDRIIKPMADILKTEYDKQKANGTLAKFGNLQHHISSDEWSDIYQVYT